MRLPRPKGFLGVLVVLLAAVAGAVAWGERNGWLYVLLPQLAPPALIAYEDEPGQSGPLLKIRDGDTVEVRYHDMVLPLRLLNVDTEESAHPDKSRNTDLGRATSKWAKAYLGSVQVRVEFKRKGWQIETDHHGRALADLWIDRGTPGPSDDDELYNETLIRLGYSRYETGFGPSQRYHKRYSEAEQLAKEAGIGVWSGSR
jgi:micrococcal nuclease